MVSTPGINSGGPPGSDNGDDRTVEIRRGDPSAATQRPQFAPGGAAPPARQPQGSAPDAPRRPNVRIGRPTAAAVAAMSDPEYFAHRRYEPAGLDHLAAVAGGPSARQRLRSLDATWTHYDHSSVDRLQRAVNQLCEAQPANEDARARTVTALLQLYEPLTQWGFSEVDLLDIVGWLARNDPSRGAALRMLHANREWLDQRGYQPSDVQFLAERPDFIDIVVALRLHHDELRAAGFMSCQIAEAARNQAGADSIAALAEHHAQLQQIGYTPSQLSRYADIYGPDLIELLAGRWQLTMESGGPLGIAEFISNMDDGQPGHLVERLRERAEALRLLRDNSEWLAQKGYEPEQMCTLAERSDFVQIMQALREYDEPLRQAGLDSMHIARAADGGAAAIAALAGSSEAEA